jgi:hypothetical protein
MPVADEEFDSRAHGLLQRVRPARDSLQDMGIRLRYSSYERNAPPGFPERGALHIYHHPPKDFGALTGRSGSASRRSLSNDAVPGRYAETVIKKKVKPAIIRVIFA